MIVINIILRVAWVTSIAPGLIFGLRKEYTLFVVAICEQIRRAIWTYIRLETEHTKNLQSGHAINLDGLDIRTKKSVTVQSPATIPWAQDYYGYGFPLGYFGVADLYQSNMVVEGDGGFYHVEPLMHMTAPAGYGGEYHDDADHHDDDPAMYPEAQGDYANAVPTAQAPAYGTSYHGERDYAAEGDVEMARIHSVKGRGEDTDEDEDIKNYGRLHTLLRDDDEE